MMNPGALPGDARGNRDTPEGPRPATVCYVLSLKNGVHSFIFREIEELHRLGVRVVILAVSAGRGPYMPRPEWPVVGRSVRGMLRGLAHALLRNPADLLRLSRTSLKTGTTVDLAIGLSFLDAASRHHPMSIHSHFGDRKLFVGYYLSRLLHRPLTVTIHAYELYANPNPRAFRQFLGSCAAVVTVSDYNRRILQDVYRVEASRTFVVRLFPWELPEIREDKKSGPFTILCVARFVPKKGLDVLLKAVKRIIDGGHSDVRLILVGKGPIDIRSMIEEMELSSYVDVLSDVSEETLRSLYEKADAFSLLSKTASGGDREGIPVSIMEAMSYGLPIVTTAHSGIPELVRETIVPEDDPETAAKALLALKEAPDRGRGRGLENRAVIRARYSPDNVKDLLEVFRRAQDATA